MTIPRLTTVAADARTRIGRFVVLIPLLLTLLAACSNGGTGGPRY